MQQNNIDIFSLSKKLTKEIETVTKKVKLMQPTGNEKTLQFEIQKLITNVLQKLNVDPFVIVEKTTYKSRRLDVIFPQVILEFKGTNLLRSKPVREKAFDELFDYIFGEMYPTKQKLVGFALDGESIIFVKPKMDKILELTKSKYEKLKRSKKYDYFDTTGPEKIDPSKIEFLLIHLRQLGKTALTPENLARDFGPTSDIGAKAVQVLYTKLKNSKNIKTKTLFNEWNRVFGIIYGENLEKAKREVKELASQYGVAKNADLKELLFSIHTYFALLMKMIACEVLSMQSEELSSFATSWSLCNDKKLKKEFTFLELGGLFKKFGITNFLEGTFFSWYLEEWDEIIAKLIRDKARKISDYEIATTTLDPDQVRDLLKKLYQYLIPKEIRHDLGEYYTPDWLAEELLNNSGFEGRVGQRILDPACGSGTFIVMAIKKILEKNIKKSQNNHGIILKNILENVAGIDINPLAVLSARVNFIIATSSLNRKSYNNVEIPIYYSDSILTPSTYSSVYGLKYEVTTSVGEFRIHQAISNKQLLGKILDVIDEVLSYNGSLEVFLNRVKQFFPQENFELVTEDLSDLYTKIMVLKKKGKDHIWTSIIKNIFAPIYLAKFDFIVGNPPWIQWEYLATEYREATKVLWEKYKLLEKKGTKGTVAQSAVDESILFTYVCADHYLKKLGTLVFLVTQGLFKSENRGRGFRRFSIPLANNKIDLQVDKVHDLTSFQPFEATNKTAFMVMIRDKQTVYPVDYIVWEPKDKILPSMTLQEVHKKVKKIKLKAVPSVQNDPLSSWLTATLDDIATIKSILGHSGYKGYIGTDTMGANAVYWIKVKQRKEDLISFENLPEIAKKKVAKKQDVIESECVYPFLRGGDIIARWKSKPVLSIIIPHTKDTGVKTIPEKTMQTNFPRTYSYLLSYKKFLKDRPGYKSRRINYEFFVLFRMNSDSFKKYKVVWSVMTDRLKAVVIKPINNKIHQNKQVITGHTTAFVGFNNLTEAHYLCSILNSSLARKAVESYSSAGRSFASTHILEHLKILPFDSSNKKHLELSELSKQAHNSGEGEKKIEEIEKQIDSIVNQIYS